MIMDQKYSLIKNLLISSVVMLENFGVKIDKQIGKQKKSLKICIMEAKNKLEK